MKEPLSNRKCLLQHHFTCPSCNTHGQHAILIFDVNDRHKFGITKLQCMDCYTAWSAVRDKNHKIIDYVIEDGKDDREHLK